MAEGRTDLDSLVETDFCNINTKVPRAILTPQLYSKVSVANSDKTGDHLKELLPFAEIESRINNVAWQHNDDVQETEDVTRRLCAFDLYERENEPNSKKFDDTHTGKEEEHDTDKFHVTCTGQEKENDTGIFSDCCIDQDGDTPLHLAIICDSSIRIILHVISIILNRFPNHDVLNYQNNIHRQTTLHLAVLIRRVDIVRLLADLGAQTTVQDSQLRTPAHIACANGDKDSLNALLESEDSEPTQSLRVYDNHGQTCTHIAVLSGNVELVQILLDHGADINAPDRKSGRTALHFAVEAGNIEMIRFLLRSRHLCGQLRVDVRTFANKTPGQLAYGREKKIPNVVEVLRRYGILDDDDDDEDDNDADSDQENY